MNNKNIRVTLLMLTIFLSISGIYANSMNDTTETKTGWTLGALPTITFDTDLGFQYGGLTNFYFYGNGSTYPEYLHSLYFEVSRFTKGSGINRFFYDSKHLIPNYRITTDISYLTEQALSFFGFNGSEAIYNPNWIDEDSELYRSRLFYAHDRKIFRFTTDLQRNFGKNFRWIAGIALYNYSIGSLDLDRLNKGNKSVLPDTASLFDLYVDWGVIPESEKDGGFHGYLKGGVVYDTRDNEPNPFKGIFTELVLSFSPKIDQNPGETHLKAALIHRQYFTLINKRLALAYRVMYQATLGDHAPFYLQPYLTTTFLRGANNEGLGGAKSIRGIMRNRIVGNDVLLTNVELRAKSNTFKILKQNIYIGLNGFVDGGMVTRNIKFNKEEILNQIALQNPDYRSNDFFNSKNRDVFHIGYGAGLRFALNENFIIAVDYAQALNKNDGTNGIYIALNYIF
ncbi:MAG: hypothetical protein RBR35_01940 [Salinivirgaceae bacterium]|nr:hypothetical protein [Salinivirgaceae bacterium]